jgi:cytochrome c-type biogenesis protein CcmH
MGEQDTLTGDFLTGTGPGGIAARSPAAGGDLAALVRSGREAYERRDWRAAIDAFKQALVRDPDNPEARTFLGLILLHAGHGDDALFAIERALTRDPNYAFALWAKGVVLFEARQDYAGAIDAWETLLARNLAPAEADRIARMITEARNRLVSQPAGPRQTPERGDTITGTVTLASSLRTALPQEGVLFIIARKGSGPPLAVKRIPNPSFPLAFALGPGDRMLAERPFEGEVTLVARLKRDGKAGPPVAGDLEGKAPTPVRIGQQGVEIILDSAR